MRAIARILAGASRDGVPGELVRYGTVVGSGYLLAIAVYPAELAAGVPAYAAFGLAFVLNGLYNFALLRVWAFPPSGRGVHVDLARFAVVALLSLLVNYAAFSILYSTLSLGAAWAQRLAIAVAAPVTFIANRLWSFREAGRTGRSEAGEEIGVRPGTTLARPRR